jgi:hypothetical protein
MKMKEMIEMKEIVKNKLYLVRGFLYAIDDVNCRFVLVNTDSKSVVHIIGYTYAKNSEENALAEMLKVIKSLEE